MSNSVKQRSEALRRNRRRFLHGMEMLEDRRQMAVSAVLAGTVLTFYGDASADVVQITSTAVPGTVTHNIGPSFGAAGVTAVVFNGFGGNDTLQLNNTAGNVFAPAGGITFNGGDGADVVELNSPGLAAVPAGTHTVTGVSSGTVAYPAPAVSLSYNQVETVNDTFSATAVTVNTSTAAENAVVEPGPLVGAIDTTTVRSNKMSTLNLGSKTSLQVNAVGGVDTVLVDGSVEPLENLTAQVSVDGGGNGDSIMILDTADVAGGLVSVGNTSVTGLRPTPFGYTNAATVTIGASQGNNTIEVATISQATLATLKVLGGGGADSFTGPAAAPMVPSLTTTVLLSGDSDSAAPVPGLLTPANPAGGLGDSFSVNVSTFAAQAEFIDTVSGQIISLQDTLAPGAHRPVYFNSMETLTALDVVETVPNTAVPFVLGDLYFRGTSADENMIFYKGAGPFDILAKRNGVLANTAPFRPTGRILAYGLDGNDYFEQNFSIRSTVSADFHGQIGNDTLMGGQGNDLLIGGVGNDVLRGGLGNDRLWGDDVADSQASRATGLNAISPVGFVGGIDRLEGGDGNDFCFGGGGIDTILGGAGNDYLHGGDGNDVITAGLGDDILRGDAGNDTLTGDEGNDILIGAAGNDKLRGASGTDFMLGGSGADAITDDDTATDLTFADNSSADADSAFVNFPLFTGLSDNDVLLQGLMFTGPNAWSGPAALNFKVTNVLGGLGGPSTPDTSVDTVYGAFGGQDWVVSQFTDVRFNVNGTDIIDFV